LRQRLKYIVVVMGGKKMSRGGAEIAEKLLRFFGAVGAAFGISHWRKRGVFSVQDTAGGGDWITRRRGRCGEAVEENRASVISNEMGPVTLSADLIFMVLCLKRGVKVGTVPRAARYDAAFTTRTSTLVLTDYTDLTDSAAINEKLQQRQ
jgi:hypothetical protein